MTKPRAKPAKPPSRPVVSTGWFGVPGGPESRSTPVHVVKGRIPICGAKVGDDQEYQWCAMGVFRGYVECKNCIRILNAKVKKVSVALQKELEGLIIGKDKGRSIIDYIKLERLLLEELRFER